MLKTFSLELAIRQRCLLSPSFQHCTGFFPYAVMREKEKIQVWEERKPSFFAIYHQGNGG